MELVNLKINKPFIISIFIYSVVLLWVKDTSVESTYILLIYFLVVIFYKICLVGYIYVEDRSQIIIKTIILGSAVIALLNGIDLGESLYGIVKLITIYIISLGLLNVTNTV